MSWGERSCKHKECPIPDECNYNTCNVHCRCYEWDGVTKPDSGNIFSSTPEIGNTFSQPKKKGLNRHQRRKTESLKRKQKK